MLMGGVIIKVFLISPLHLVRLCTLSGCARVPACYVRVRSRFRMLCHPSLALRSSFAHPSLNYSQQKLPKIALHFFFLTCNYR